MRAQPSPKANRTDPVTSGSVPPDAGPSSKATARRAPAVSEPMMAMTGERVLVPRGMTFDEEVLSDETFTTIPPRMRERS
jgi:hypothetical protein